MFAKWTSNLSVMPAVKVRYNCPSLYAKSIHSLAKSVVLNLLLVHLCPNYIKIFEFSGWNFFINKMETESQRLLGVLPCSLTQIGVLFIDYYISKDRLISLPLHCLEQSSILLASRGFFHWLFMHEFCFFFLLFSWMGELFLSCLITDWCDGEDLE